MEYNNVNNQAGNNKNMTSSSSSFKHSVGWSATEETISIYFVCFLSLLSLALIATSKLHLYPRVQMVLPEVGLILLLGAVAGAFIRLFRDSIGNDNNNNYQNNQNSKQREYDDFYYDDDVYSNSAEQDIADGLLTFSPTVFFLALLPPILFNAGYHIKRDLFFRYLKPTLVYAIVGTCLSTLTVALVLQYAVLNNWTGSFQPTFVELLTFGALISATDPVSLLANFQRKRVDPQLFYLCFGESMLNDAIALVLFGAFSKFVGAEESVSAAVLTSFAFFLDFLYLFIGSLCLGLTSGTMSGYVLKVMDLRPTPLLELSFYIMIMYLPFFVAEMCHLSGIVTILFTGITAKWFAEPNLSDQTKVEADNFFRLAAHMAEAAIYLDLGLALFGLPVKGDIIHGKFIMFSILAILVGRASNVYPMSLCYNLYIGAKYPIIEINDPADESCCGVSTVIRNRMKNDKKLNWKTAHMLWFAGLRGAVAYACSKSFPDDNGHRDEFVMTTMMIIYFTTFAFGSTTELALKLLKVETDVDEEAWFQERPKHEYKGVFDRFNALLSPIVIRDYDEMRARELGLSGSWEAEFSSWMATAHRSPYLSASPGRNLPGIERTMSDHLELSQMEGYYTRDGYALRERASLYDFGASPTSARGGRGAMSFG